MTRLITYFLLWIPMIILGVFNGAFRELVYQPHIHELTAHQISSITAILVLGAYIWVVTQRWQPWSAADALRIGAWWAFLTVTFEFVMGYFIMHHPWSRLFADYNVLEGRLWSLVVLWLMISPWIFYKFRPA